MLVYCQFGAGSSFFLNFLLGFSFFGCDFSWNILIHSSSVQNSSQICYIELEQACYQNAMQYDVISKLLVLCCHPPK